MKFTEIDITKWPRGQVFYYFSQMAPTSYSMTVEIDVTELLRVTKERNVKFFPAYLWVVTKCLNKQVEFKVAYENEKLGFYDVLTPLYATFHDDDKTFSLMWAEYDDDFAVFYQRYIDNQRQFGDNHGILAQAPMMPPANAYTVSAVPWVDFQHFAVHTHDAKPYFFPSIEAGRFVAKEDGRVMMPLSITCHHATTDGYHVKLFLDDLKEEMAAF